LYRENQEFMQLHSSYLNPKVLWVFFYQIASK
jgi:hypothetical protein